MDDPNIPEPVRVTRRGAARWSAGHPWIYRSDVLDPVPRPGVVRVTDQRGRLLGQALASPASEITLRLLETGERPVDADWWRAKLKEALCRRAGIDANAWRLVHAEGDGLPSLIVDRYDRWVVAQFLSAGLESMRSWIVAALHDLLSPEGILLRNDVPVRRHERLPETVELVLGTVPDQIEVREGPVRYQAAPWTGQKTGAFLDQRPNRIRIAQLARPGGRALDCFSYHGSFALHLATRSAAVVALDASEDALARGESNAALNGLTNITWRRGDVFEVLREFDRARTRFDTIVLDPPAFAKTRDAVPAAIRGYHEINRRAMRLLEPGGLLLTASCSYHVRRADFERMLSSAAADSGRRVALVEWIGQGVDHPEILTIPETGYLKGAILRST